MSATKKNTSNSVSDYRFNDDNNCEDDARNKTLQRISGNERAFGRWQAEKVSQRPRFDNEIGDADGGHCGDEEEEREMVQNGDT